MIYGRKIFKEILSLGVEERAQSIKCLPWKHGGLNSIPRTCVKMWCGGNLCHPNTEKGIWAVFVAHWPPTLPTWWASCQWETLIQKNKVLYAWGTTPEVVFCLFMHVYTHAHSLANTRVPIYTCVTVYIHIQRRHTAPVLSRHRIFPIIFLEPTCYNFLPNIYIALNTPLWRWLKTGDVHR